MTYEEACAFLDKTKEYGSILGLTSIRSLMAELSDIQETLPVIHIAGTNGKGSVGAMLAAVLMESGYSVGRYTSPAVFAYEEIFTVDGIPITHEEFAEEASVAREACERMTARGEAHPTSFEVETAIAFLYFARKKCDFVLLETGLGGREDATNIIAKPICSVLTSISMDHMGFLGNSLTAIASAKAGIIKEGCPVVSAWQHEEALAVIEQEAERKNAELIVADESLVQDVSYDEGGLAFTYAGFGRAVLTLTGACQTANAACAIETLLLLGEKGYCITEHTIREGLKKASWSGRFETIHPKPLCIIDGAHNEEAALQLRKTIENCFTNRRITYIIGVLADKEHEKMLRIMLPLAMQVYTVTPNNPRALSADRLAEEAAKYHKQVTAMTTIDEALTCALQNAGEDGVIIAFGSLSYLADVKRALAGTGNCL